MSVSLSHKGIAHGARKEKVGGLPALRRIKSAFPTYRSPQGDCGIFCSTGFFLFPGPYPSSAKSQQPGAYTRRCARFFYVGKCRFLLFPVRTSQPRCRGPPSVWISSRNSDETEVHSVDAGKKKIWVRGQFVEVTDEVYTAYMRGDRKMRYFEADLKSERPVYGSNGEIKQVLPAGRIPWTGSWKKMPASFAAAAESVEDVVIRKLRWTSYIPRLCSLPKKNGISFVPCSLTRKQKAKWQRDWAFPSRPSTSGKAGYSKI